MAKDIGPPVLQVGQWSTDYSDSSAADRQLVAKLYEETAPAVVLIKAVSENDGKRATGFFADKEGHIITDGHAIPPTGTLSVTTADGIDHQARVLKIDEKNDLAELSLVDGSGPSYSHLNLGESVSEKPGNQLYAVGFPGFASEAYISPGHVNSESPFGQFISTDRLRQYLRTAGKEAQAAAQDAIKRPLIVASMDTQPGSSGSPAVNAKGEVVGVVDLATFPYGTTDLTPVTAVRRLLDERSDKFKFDYEKEEKFFLSEWKTGGDPVDMILNPDDAKSDMKDQIFRDEAELSQSRTLGEKIRSGLAVTGDMLMVSGSPLTGLAVRSLAGKSKVTVLKGISRTSGETSPPFSPDDILPRP